MRRLPQLLGQCLGHRCRLAIQRLAVTEAVSPEVKRDAGYWTEESEKAIGMLGHRSRLLN